MLFFAEKRKKRHGILLDAPGYAGFSPARISTLPHAIAAIAESH
jgi:hypothetical protein